MSLVGRILTLGWMTAILVVQMSVAEHSRWALNTRPRVLWDLSAEELECVHNFLMSRKELELQPSTVLTLAKNSVFLIEMLMPKKYEVLDFLDKGAMPPLREARVLIYFGAQEYPNVTEYAVGPVDQPMYMRKLNRKGGQELSWVSRPMSKVESALLFHTLKTATKPLQEFFFDTTGFTLQDCNGGCLTFTNVGPRDMTFRNRHSWFLLQRFMNGHFLQPTGLEILVDHGSTDVQDWRVVQIWYNGKFYSSPEELAQKYADGEVDIVVLEDPLPKTSEQFPQFSTYKPHAEFLMPISKGGPRVVQPYPEFPMPIRKGGPRVAQPYPEFSMPISKGGPRVPQPYSEFSTPIRKGGPRVPQPYSEFPTPIRKGGPQVAQPYPEFSIPISKGGPRVPQPYSEFPTPIRKGGPRVPQPYSEFPTPIRKGGPRVPQPYSEFPTPIRKGGPQVTHPYSEFPTPISKGGPQVAQPYPKFPRPISKGGPQVAQLYPKFPTPIRKGGPQVAQSSVPRYRLKHNTVLYGDWSFFFKLQSSYGLQLFNVHFRGERIAYEVGVQEVMALYKGHKAGGRETKYVDVGWGLGGITHQLTPGIDCPHKATFLDAIHYYDSDGPVLSRQALCIFEVPVGVPLRHYFNSNFRSSFSSYARLGGPMLVLRTASTIHNHDYIWDFIFHSNGIMEGKMYATGYVHATFYTSEGMLYHSRLHTHLLGNVHSHLAHYRIDLDVAGTKNSFQTLKMRLENITDPWSQRSQQVKPIFDKTQYSQERQAAFHFRQTLPKYLLFSNTGKSVLGRSHSYLLHVPSMAEQMLPPGWQNSPAFLWPRYQLAVTKYQESERFHSSLYNQNHHWAYPMVFENFIHNNENIEDEDLVAWVTVGLSNNLHSEIAPSTATLGNAAGFLLQPFDLYNNFQRYTASPTRAQCVC
ncbi:seminal vesicle secretory protein 1 precursor [Rattus norvegicus]|uniref:Amine oxidase n=2 Tax=Rattus norvegicus TaxID=10116 RepID=Q6IMK4_RAT|nr:seminal vesicle secretory protein 1 precursor [Rattus norvegicus]DAA02040.1 TPA_exp: seminal vesicle-secreted protein I [Rattus norvegicus]|eukprot:NP_954526.1 seminal vesicle secretory protein 1 precursor [Rattus norvegicus]